MAMPDRSVQITRAKCRSCSAEIVWLKTATGRQMPVDAATVEAGDVTFDGKRHRSHFATCPTAFAHRRRN